MLVSRGRNPSAGEVISQAVTSPELRNRILTTIGLLLLVRIGIYIPMPGIDRVRFQEFLEGGGNLLSSLDIFTGGGVSTLGVFALGILPFINASIIMQLLTASLPQLEDLQKNEGEAGRRKIAQITRYVALGWGLIQSVVFALILKQYATEGLSEVVFVIQTALALVTGAMVVMWIRSDHRAGHWSGASLVIFLSIVATLPSTLGNAISQAQLGGRQAVIGLATLTLVFLATIVGIVFVQEASRRLPIVSAKRQIGGTGTLPSRQSYLPMKLNAGGVMPIIFASAMLFLPATLAQVTKQEWLAQAVGAIQPGNTAYYVLYFALILGFSYFYASLTLNPTDIASNLKRGGVAIPGVRPGTATANYISGVQARLTLLGGLFLGAVVIIPSLLENSSGIRLGGLGSTSLLILVGVAIETAKQVKTYVVSQRYEGMVRE